MKNSAALGDGVFKNAFAVYAVAFPNLFPDRPTSRRAAWAIGLLEWLRPRDQSRFEIFTSRAKSRALFWCVVLAAFGFARGVEASDSPIPGAIDPTFNPGAMDGAVRCLALQSDGKIVIAGDFTSINGIARRGLARLNADGTLDPGFTPASELSLSASNHITDIALQTDGSLLVGGLFDLVAPGAPTNTTYLVVRLTSDGGVDWTYGPVLVERVRAPLESMAIQPDDRLLIGFRTKDDNLLPDPPPTSGSHIVRLKSNGQSDPSFSPASLYDPFLPRNTRQICLEPSGAILTKWDIYAGYYDFLARFDAHGTPAPFLYTIEGIQTGMGPGLQPYIAQVICDPDGHLVLNGWFNLADAPRLYQNGYSVARLMPNGKWDHLLAVQVRSAAALAVLPSHRVLAVVNGVLCRLNSVGAMDPYWQNHQVSPGGIDPNWHDYRASTKINVARVQSDGRVLLGGDFSFAGYERILRLEGDDPTPRPPVILQSPTNQVLMNTNEILLSVWADGCPLTYQWLRNGSPMAGQTNDAIRVKAESANYSVVVSNAMGVVTSSVAQVGVLDLAMALNTPGWTWSAPPASSKDTTCWHVDTNLTHDGSASAVGWSGWEMFTQTILQTTVQGPGTLTFWQTGRTSHFHIRNSLWNESVWPSWAWYSSLSTDGSQPGPWRQETFSIPSGQYQLRWIPNTYPEACKNCYLDEVSFISNPAGAPKILTRQSKGESAVRTLSVVVSASDLPLSYQWFNNRFGGLQAIPGATNATLSVNTNDLPPVAVYYAVVVSNALGTVVSEPAEVVSWGTNSLARLSANLNPQDRQLRLTVAGASRPTVIIQTSSNMLGWLDWATVVCTNGASSVVDRSVQSGPEGKRFYRAIYR
jgi:uncharacterized delta-60 repeat protein